MKWDGHSHTELCRHGKQESTKKMIEQALALGFTHYSLTEHAPLPEGVAPKGRQAEFALLEEEMEAYFTLAEQLKQDFQGRIEVLVGLEVDFLHAHQAYTTELLHQYGPRLDDAILSMHYMPGAIPYAMIDYSPEITRQDLLAHYGTVEAYHQAYWNAFQQMLTADLGPFKPKRIGHAGIIYKFCQKLDFGAFLEPSLSFFEQIGYLLKQGGYSLDDNFAGASYPLCRRPYLPKALRQLAEELSIPLVYGSDAHGIDAVKKSNEAYEAFCQHGRIRPRRPECGPPTSPG